MTLINILTDKFLTLIGQGDIAATRSSSHILFGIFAIVLVVAGLMTIANRHPVLSKYKGYTKESVANASTLLGVCDIILGLVDVVIGVLTVSPATTFPIGCAAIAGMLAFITLMSAATTRLVKVTKA